MKCGLCGHIIDKGFTNPASHKKGCPIFTDSKGVSKVIAKESKKR